MIRSWELEHQAVLNHSGQEHQEELLFTQRPPFDSKHAPDSELGSFYGRDSSLLVTGWAIAQWFRTAKDRDISTGPLACLFASLLALLTCVLAPHCLLHSRRSAALICSLSWPFTHSQAHGKEDFVNDMHELISYRFNPQCTGWTIDFGRKSMVTVENKAPELQLLFGFLLFCFVFLFF